MLMKTPYIGITDFTTPKESKMMLDFFAEVTEYKLPHKLMVGVMMSRKTLCGLPTKWGSVFPAKEKVSEIFIEHPLAMNTLHYADYDGVDVKNNLFEAIRWSGRNVHALQLDMIWPPAEALKELRGQYPSLKIVLQVGTNAFDEISNSPAALLSQLEEYKKNLDYVLLDRSMGRGLGMNPDLHLSHFQILSSMQRDLGIAIAGGLGPNTVQVIETLVAEFPNLSIDAQGKLRPSGNALDPIDWNMARKYLSGAVEIFKKYY